MFGIGQESKRSSRGRREGFGDRLGAAVPDLDVKYKSHLATRCYSKNRLGVDGT